jgi:hypothetical protein
MQETLEITYENALIYLRPKNIIETYAAALKGADEIDKTISMVETFYRKNAGKGIAVLNGVLIYCMRLLDGVVPNENYLRKTLQSFMANSITTPEKIVKHIINRAEFTTKKQTEKQEIRNDFYKHKVVEKAKNELDSAITTHEINQAKGNTILDDLNQMKAKKIQKRS